MLNPSLKEPDKSGFNAPWDVKTACYKRQWEGEALRLPEGSTRYLKDVCHCLLADL